MTAVFPALACLVAATFAASYRSAIVGGALGGTAILNGALIATGTNLVSNHPVRLIGPVLVMASSYVVMSTPRTKRAYSIARLVFSLAFASEFAPLCFELWGEWSLPVASTVVCLVVVAHAFAPKGCLKWLPV